MYISILRIIYYNDCMVMRELIENSQEKGKEYKKEEGRQEIEVKGANQPCLGTYWQTPALFVRFHFLAETMMKLYVV